MTTWPCAGHIYHINSLCEWLDYSRVVHCLRPFTGWWSKSVLLLLMFCSMTIRDVTTIDCWMTTSDGPCLSSCPVGARVWSEGHCTGLELLHRCDCERLRNNWERQVSAVLLLKSSPLLTLAWCFVQERNHGVEREALCLTSVNHSERVHWSGWKHSRKIRGGLCRLARLWVCPCLYLFQLPRCQFVVKLGTLAAEQFFAHTTCLIFRLHIVVNPAQQYTEKLIKIFS